MTRSIAPFRARARWLALTSFVLAACSDDGSAAVDTDAETSDGTAGTSSAPSTTGDGDTSTPDATSDADTTSSMDGMDSDTTAGSTGSDGGDTTAAVDGSETSGGGECSSDDDCDSPDAPFCARSMCVPCSGVVDGDAACASKFADAGVCENDNCVQCTARATDACTGTTPVCDAGTNACIGCSSHADCPDSACHIPATVAARATPLDGACFDPANVVTAAGGIGAAVAAVPAGGERVILLPELAAAYEDIVTVDGGRSIALLAAPGDAPVWIGIDTPGPHLTITGASTVVFLQGVTIRDNNGIGGPAIDVITGRLHMQRSQIANNAGIGISADDSALVHAENSFIGGSATNLAAIDVDNSDATILYSTLVSSTGSSRALNCVAPGTVDVRNSLLFTAGGADPVSCAGATFLNNLSEQGLGVGNATTPQAYTGQGSWFDDYPTGDLHLNGGLLLLIDPCLVGVWETGDPPTDIDGDLRPTMNDATDCAGADVN